MYIMGKNIFQISEKAEQNNFRSYYLYREGKESLPFETKF